MQCVFYLYTQINNNDNNGNNPIVCFTVGGGLSYMLFRYGLKIKYDIIIKDAEAEAEVIKKNKLLEVKEKFLNKKADLEKEVALRNQKIQQAENKLKQRELMY